MENFDRVINGLKDMYGLPKIQGGCLKFHLLLKLLFPNVTGYYNSRHVITKVGEKFYDRKGEYDGAFGPLDKFLPLSQFGYDHMVGSFKVKLSDQEKETLKISTYAG